LASRLVNGQADGMPAGKRRAVTLRGSSKRRGLSTDQKAGLVVAAPGLSLLALSVQHCTESISLLTGAPQYQSCLMALGIDAGLVACEYAALRLTRARRGTGWASGYIIGAVLLSMLLNSYSFGLHAPAGMVWAAWLFGMSIPAGIYAAGRVAGQMWLRE
jgi:hypothetical protein